MKETKNENRPQLWAVEIPDWSLTYFRIVNVEYFSTLLSSRMKVISPVRLIYPDSNVSICAVWAGPAMCELGISTHVLVAWTPFD